MSKRFWREDRTEVSQMPARVCVRSHLDSEKTAGGILRRTSKARPSTNLRYRQPRSQHVHLRCLGRDGGRPVIPRAQSPQLPDTGRTPATFALITQHRVLLTDEPTQGPGPSVFDHGASFLLNHRTKSGLRVSSPKVRGAARRLLGWPLDTSGKARPCGHSGGRS